MVKLKTTPISGFEEFFVNMKGMDGPSVTEMDRGGIYEMDWQKNWNATEMDKIL